MLNMAPRNDISVDVVNKIPIRGYGRNKRDKTFKYTILNNGAYCMHHYWDKNQKLRVKVVLPCPWYVHYGFGFKLVMQTFMYNILPKKEGFWGQLQCDLVNHLGGQEKTEYNWKSKRWVKEQGIIRGFDNN